MLQYNLKNKSMGFMEFSGKTMNKFFYLLLGLCCYTSSAFAQDDLKKENDYLRNALKINTPITKTTLEEVEISIVKIEGNSTNQTVVVTLLLNNKAANRTFQWNLSDMKAVDVEGNSYKINPDHGRNIIHTDVPVRSQVVIQQVLPKTKIIKLLALPFYPLHPNTRSPIAEFRDLPVEWN